VKALCWLIAEAAAGGMFAGRRMMESGTPVGLLSKAAHNGPARWVVGGVGERNVRLPGWAYGDSDPRWLTSFLVSSSDFLKATLAVRANLSRSSFKCPMWSSIS